MLEDEINVQDLGKLPVMAKRRRVCCVIKPTGWANKNKLKKVFDSIQNLNKFGEQMKISRQILAGSSEMFIFLPHCYYDV